MRRRGLRVKVGAQLENPMNRLAAACLTAFALAACAQNLPATSPGPAAPPPTISGDCKAEGAQSAVGQTLSGPLQEDIRVRSNARLVRVIRPGQAVTMDFNAERVNIELDAAGRVERVRCG
jgi:hypothetical protein